MLRAYIELEIKCIAAANECTVEENECTVEIFWCTHIISKKCIK